MYMDTSRRQPLEDTEKMRLIHYCSAVTAAAHALTSHKPPERLRSGPMPYSVIPEIRSGHPPLDSC